MSLPPLPSFPGGARGPRAAVAVLLAAAMLLGACSGAPKAVPATPAAPDRSAAAPAAPAAPAAQAAGACTPSAGGDALPVSRASTTPLFHVGVVTPPQLQQAVTPGHDAPADPGAVSLEYEPKPVAFTVPGDSKLLRWVTVHNNGAQPVALQFDAMISGPNGFSMRADDLGVAPLPQPNHVYLQPGEAQLIWISAGWNEIGNRDWQPGQSYEYRIDLRVYPQGDDAQAQHAMLVSTVKVVDGIGPIQNTPTDVTVSGCVTDAATHAPIAHAQVDVDSAAFGSFHGETDGGGVYRVQVAAYDSVTTGSWVPERVTVRAPGYADFNRSIAPHNGTQVAVDAALTHQTETADYQLTTKYDTTLNINQGRVSADGRYVALVHFHSIVPPGQNADTYLGAAQLMYFTTDGQLLWKFPLYDETPAVAISSDGQLVATARNARDRSDGGIYLLDGQGQVVWYIKDPGQYGPDMYREVALSPDNKYLATGDSQGHLYLFDIAARRLVWQRFVGGQVRALAFEPADGTLYAGSGDGFLYAFAPDGTATWRTYIGAWPIAFTVSQHYIVTGGKEGHFVSLIDKQGHVVWEYPVRDVAHEVVVAPDESFILATGTDNQFGALVIGKDGVLQYALSPAEPGFVLSDSRHILLTGQDVNEQDQGKIWVEMLDRGGSVLWHTSLDMTVHRGPTGGFAWASPDGSRLIVASGQWVYFFHGGIQSQTQ